MMVIQEIFGLTDWLRSMCDELAENGVIAIAPDFLNGQKFEDADSASKAVSAVTQDQVKAVLDATADYALKIPACNGTLAVCGFCRGGGWAFAYANEYPKLKAVYSFYGTAPDEASKIANIAVSCLRLLRRERRAGERNHPKGRRANESRRQKIRTGDLQRCRPRFHAVRRAGQSLPFAKATKKARDEAWAALEDAAEAAAIAFSVLPSGFEESLIILLAPPLDQYREMSRLRST